MSRIRIQLNGEPREVDDPLTVSGLLAKLEIKLGRVAVELNGNVVPRAEHYRTPIKPGDQIEIINFVGGG